MSDNNTTKGNNTSSYSWIDTVPVGIAICSQQTKKILTHNDLFMDMIEKETDVKDLDNFVCITNLTYKEAPRAETVEFEYGGKDTFVENVIFSPIIFQEEEAWLCVFRYVFDMTRSYTDTFDSATGVYTKSAGYGLFNQHLEETKYVGTIFSISYLKITSPNGEPMRDDKLISAVGLVHKTIRGSDIFARLSPTEFFIIFPKCPEAVAESIMITLLNRFSLIGADIPEEAIEIEYTHGIVEIGQDSSIKLPREAIEVASQQTQSSLVMF